MPVTRVATSRRSHDPLAVIIEIDGWVFEIERSDLAVFDTAAALKTEIERQAVLGNVELPPIFFHKNRDGSFALAVGGREPVVWPEDEPDSELLGNG